MTSHRLITLLILCFITWVLGCKPMGNVRLKNVVRNESKSPLGVTVAFLNKKPGSYLKESKEFADRHDLDTLVVTAYDLAPELFVIDNYRSTSKEQFEEMLKFYHIDTSQWDSNRYDAEALFVIGRATNGDCIYAADENNNNLISDDPVHTIKNWFHSDRIIPKENLPIITLRNLETNFNHKKQTFKRSIILNPYRRDTVLNHDSALLALGLHLVSIDYKVGKFRSEGTKYKIVVRNTGIKYYYDDLNTVVSIVERKDPYPFPTKKTSNYLYKISEVHNVKEGAFKIDSVGENGAFVKLSKASRNTEEYIQNMSFTDVLSEKNFNVNEYFKNKDYLLIDFWGTWCGPCIAALPELKNLQLNLIDQRIGFIGIAYDDSTKIDKIKSIANQFGMNWPQMLGRTDDKIHPIFSENRINTFPSYLLIDKNRKILFRTAGLGAVDQIVNFIQNDLQLPVSRSVVNSGL